MGDYSVKQGKGETNYNSFGSLMIIIEFKNTRNIIVYFPEYKWKTKTTYANFTRGNIHCPYEPRIRGKGFMGEGEYGSRGNDVRCYDTWNKMLERCYSEEFHDKHPTYTGCTVCDDWLNYQNFAAWYYDNFYDCFNGDRMCLDKDILYKNNKIYSPETCIFVPARINKLFTKRQVFRGDCLIGTRKDPKCTTEIWITTCHGVDGKMQYLGRFRTQQEAFIVYKSFKEKTIKLIADEYKDLIPMRLYNALYNYVVEEND